MIDIGSFLAVCAIGAVIFIVWATLGHLTVSALGAEAALSYGTLTGVAFGAWLVWPFARESGKASVKAND